MTFGGKLVALHINVFFRSPRFNGSVRNIRKFHMLDQPQPNVESNDLSLGVYVKGVNGFFFCHSNHNY